MDKIYKELMQTTVLSENVELSKMLEDLKPQNIQESKFLDEIQNKKQEFRIVVYKKDNVIKKFFKDVGFGIKKFSKIFFKKNMATNRAK